MTYPIETLSCSNSVLRERLKGTTSDEVEWEHREVLQQMDFSYCGSNQKGQWSVNLCGLQVIEPSYNV